jgi:hypothetical protein
MPSQIRFFATKNDLVPVLEALEAAREIKYVRFGVAGGSAPASFSAVAVLPKLGIASHESSINSDTYLICGKAETLRAREVARGFVFDQLVNPDTVTFTPGGFWGEDVLLHGRFATASATPFSSDLMKLLGSVARKRFKKVKAFYVGPEAEHCLDRGKRLAIAAQSPRTLDLSRA